MKTVSKTRIVLAMAGLALTACSRQPDTTAAMAAQAAAVTAQEDARKQAEQQAVDAANAQEPAVVTSADPAARTAAGPQAAAPGGGKVAGSAAQRIFIDPATGKARQPTDAEMAAVATRLRNERVSTQSTRAGAEEQESVTLPDGEVRVHVGERAMHSVRVCRLPNGKFGECDAAASEQQMATDRAAGQKAADAAAAGAGNKAGQP